MVKEEKFRKRRKFTLWHKPAFHLSLGSLWVGVDIERENAPWDRIFWHVEIAPCPCLRVCFTILYDPPVEWFLPVEAEVPQATTVCTKCTGGGCPDCEDQEERREPDEPWML